MPTRTARTAWNGTLQEGSGQVKLSSSKVGTYEVSFPKRAAEDADGTTSPEELVAAAHSACFAMQLSANIAQAGGTPQSLEVKADVSLGPDDANGGFRLTGITLTVRGEVEGPTGWLARNARTSAGVVVPAARAASSTLMGRDAWSSRNRAAIRYRRAWASMDRVRSRGSPASGKHSRAATAR